MTPIDFVAGVLAGMLFFGKLLLLLVAAAMVTCVLIVAVVAEDIYRTIRIRKERRLNAKRR